MGVVYDNPRKNILTRKTAVGERTRQITVEVALTKALLELIAKA